MYYSFIIIHQKNLYVKEKLVGTTDGEQVGIIDRNTSGSFIFSAKHCIHILIQQITNRIILTGRSPSHRSLIFKYLRLVSCLYIGQRSVFGNAGLICRVYPLRQRVSIP